VAPPFRPPNSKPPTIGRDPGGRAYDSLLSDKENLDPGLISEVLHHILGEPNPTGQGTLRSPSSLEESRHMASPMYRMLNAVGLNAAGKGASMQTARSPSLANVPVNVPPREPPMVGRPRPAELDSGPRHFEVPSGPMPPNFSQRVPGQLDNMPVNLPMPSPPVNMPGSLAKPLMGPPPQMQPSLAPQGQVPRPPPMVQPAPLRQPLPRAEAKPYPPPGAARPTMPGPPAPTSQPPPAPSSPHGIDLYPPAPQMSPTPPRRLNTGGDAAPEGIYTHQQKWGNRPIEEPPGQLVSDFNPADIMSKDLIAKGLNSPAAIQNRPEVRGQDKTFIPPDRAMPQVRDVQNGLAKGFNEGQHVPGHQVPGMHGIAPTQSSQEEQDLILDMILGRTRKK
jgi:hypothetical protein